MRVSMRLPAGLEWLESSLIAIMVPDYWTVQEVVYAYKKNPRVHYLVHTRDPANERVLDGTANPYFLARYVAMGNVEQRRSQARERLFQAFIAHYSRPESEWNKDVKGNVLLSVTEPEQEEEQAEQAEQGSWRDRPPML